MGADDNRNFRTTGVLRIVKDKAACDVQVAVKHDNRMGGLVVVVEGRDLCCDGVMVAAADDMMEVGYWICGYFDVGEQAAVVWWVALRFDVSPMKASQKENMSYVPDVDEDWNNMGGTKVVGTVEVVMNMKSRVTKKRVEKTLNVMVQASPRWLLVDFQEE